MGQTVPFSSLRWRSLSHPNLPPPHSLFYQAEVTEYLQGCPIASTKSNFNRARSCNKTKVISCRHVQYLKGIYCVDHIKQHASQPQHTNTNHQKVCLNWFYKHEGFSFQNEIAYNKEHVMHVLPKRGTKIFDNIDCRGNS
jgi:hypothetical protein